MSRIRRGWELTKKSWAVLRENRQLLRFPLYGGVALIAMSIVLLGPGLFLIEEGEIAPAAPLVILALYLMAFVGFYFSVGLAAAADRIFRGEPATVSDGLAVSRSRLPQIAGWAALATTVGVALNLLAEQGGVVGSIVSRLLDIGWSLITFLAVPVIAFEGTAAFATLKRSATLFKSRWGQQVTGNIAIGGAVFLFGILPSAILVAAGIYLWSASGFAGAILVIVGVIGIAIAAMISQALSGIFGVALYRYALDGEPVGGFSHDEMESAVKPRRGAPQPATI